MLPLFWALRRRQLPQTKEEIIWTNQKVPLMIHLFWPGFRFTNTLLGSDFQVSWRIWLGFTLCFACLSHHQVIICLDLFLILYSVFVRLKKNLNKYWDCTAVYFPLYFALDQWEKIAALAGTVRRGCVSCTQAVATSLKRDNRESEAGNQRLKWNNYRMSTNLCRASFDKT